MAAFDPFPAWHLAWHLFFGPGLRAPWVRPPQGHPNNNRSNHPKCLSLTCNGLEQPRGSFVLLPLLPI